MNITNAPTTKVAASRARFRFQNLAIYRPNLRIATAGKVAICQTGLTLPHPRPKSPPPPPIRDIIFWNFPIFFIICCIWPNFCSIVLS